jgi:hypothetical protein
MIEPRKNSGMKCIHETRKRVSMICRDDGFNDQ